MNNLKSLFYKHVGQTSDQPYALEVSHGKGVYLYDFEGHRYLDLISGIGPAATGHAHPKVVEAIHHQAQKYTHSMVYGEHIQGPQVELASYLSTWSPPNLDACYFVSSGTEATEVAIKLARKATGRKEIIACRNAYHGSTHGAAALMSDDWLTQAFRPLMPGVRFIDYNEHEGLKEITRNTAAVIVETFQGEAGCKVAEKSWFQSLRKKCDETGTLLILDEIQVGLGRTGKKFAFEHVEIIPDAILLAKALGGGLPLGAVHASQDLLAELALNPILGHCTTYGGNPVSCAAGLAALKIIESDKLYEQVEHKAHLFRTSLSGAASVKGISGKGLWMAVDVGSFEQVEKLMWLAKSKGLITDWFLFNNHSFRICPPLVIEEAEVLEAIEILLKVLEEIN